MGNRADRINQMTNILRETRTLKISEMAERLGCSDMTIRRDLKNISSDVPLRVVNGVIFVDIPMDASYEISSETIKHDEKKKRIGKFAATLLEPNDIIIIDGGTTTEKMIPHIDESLGITALCYNYNILTELHKKTGIILIVAGGYYHPSTAMFESPSGIQMISEVRANKLFLSCAGVHERLGLTSAQNHEATTIQTAIASSLYRILLTDSSKFGMIRPAYTAPLSDIDVIVTDDGLPEEWRKIIKSLGIKLYLV